MLALLQTLDARGVRGCVRLRHPQLTRVMRAITYSADAKAWVAATVLLAGLWQVELAPATVLPLLKGALSALVAWVIGNTVRFLVRRPRPFRVVAGCHLCISAPLGASMPSTHAATSFALATSLWIHGHPLAPWVTGWAALTSFSRLYLGVHYTSDLVAGAAIGLLAAFAALF